MILAYSGIDTNEKYISNKSINKLSSLEVLDISDEETDILENNEDNDIYIGNMTTVKNFGDLCESDEDFDTEKHEKHLKEHRYMSSAIITLDNNNDIDSNISMMIEYELNNKQDIFIPLRDNPCNKRCSYDEIIYDNQKKIIIID